MKLTQAQTRVLDYLHEFYTVNDQIPPAHRIAQHFGWASPNAAQQHLERLAARGYLRKNAVGKWRFTQASRPNTTADA